MQKRTLRFGGDKWPQKVNKSGQWPRGPLSGSVHIFGAYCDICVAMTAGGRNGIDDSPFRVPLRNETFISGMRVDG
jgi:hypothetical protein